MESIEHAVLKNHRERLNSAEGCPPDFLVRAAVLKTDEPILSHIAECRHCTNIYMGALGSEWHPKHRRSNAPSETPSRSANWFAKLGAPTQETLHMPATPHSTRP